MSNIQLAANLQRLRKDHHFTQTQFSKKLNISRQAYSNYETGKRIPDLDIIIRIANIYHISLENLLTQTCSKDGLINETFAPRFFRAGRKPQHFRECEMGYPQAVQERRDWRGQQAHPRLPIR